MIAMVTHGDVEVPVDGSAAQIVPVVQINAQCVLTLRRESVQIIQSQPQVISGTSKSTFVLVPVPLQKCCERVVKVLFKEKSLGPVIQNN